MIKLCYSIVINNMIDVTLMLDQGAPGPSVGTAGVFTQNQTSYREFNDTELKTVSTSRRASAFRERDISPVSSVIGSFDIGSGAGTVRSH